MSQDVAIFTDDGRLLSGADRLAQAAVVEILTEKGSLVHDPLRGTDFLSRLRSIAVHTEYSALSALAAARLAVKRNFRSRQEADAPASERLATITVVRAVVTDGRLVVTLEVTNELGESARQGLSVSVRL